MASRLNEPMADGNGLPLQTLLGQQQREAGLDAESAHWYVLCDVDVHKSWDLAALLLAAVSRPDSTPINLYADLAEVGIAANGPRLVEISASTRVSQTLLTQSPGLRGASFLASTSSLATVAAHLQTLREADMPDGSTALFRFQDTRVMHALAPTLDAKQAAAVLGPVANWWSVDPCGEVSTLKLNSSKHKLAPPRLKLRQAQMTTVDQALAPYELLAQTRAADGAVLNGLSECAQLRAARLHIAKAHALGLKQQADVAMFGVLAFQLPEGFEAQTPFEHAISSAAQNKAKLGDALKQVKPQEWQNWNDWLAKHDGMH